MIIAGKTSKAKITGLGATAVLASDDVVDLEMKVQVLMRQLTVFAPAARPLPDQFF